MAINLGTVIYISDVHQVGIHILFSLLVPSNFKNIKKKLVSNEFCTQHMKIFIENAFLHISTYFHLLVYLSI